MRTVLNKVSLSVMAILLSPALAGAAETAKSAPGGFNAAVIGLVCLMFVLLLAIAVLANVLSQLTLIYRDKMRAEKQKKNEGTVAKAILLLICLSIPSLHVFAADTDTAKAVVVEAPYISGLANTDFYVLIGVLALELLIVFGLVFYIKAMARAISTRPAATKESKKRARAAFWDRFNKVVPIEKEKDIMLDHDYDGIHELDNSLPPWWKYGFYLTIVVACIYLYRFHVSGTGPSSHDEYVAEMKQAEEDKAAYLAKTAGNIDENNVTALTAATDIAAGQQIFQSTCFACHAKDGGGGVGPNLTDDYWLHGGSIKDVFKSIKYGWQDKGMKSWKDDFSPKQIAQIASYVKSLHGTKPAAPKDKQGDLYNESGPAPTDSTKANKVAVN
jgi:cytochrome c oxidase cbb3-type subunit 3